VVLTRRMKKLTIILFFLLTLLSCSTPEEKILDSFNEHRMARRRSTTLEVKEVKIYDTLFYTDLVKAWDNIEKNKPILENKLKRMEHYRDSVLSSKPDRSKLDSLMHADRIKRERYDRQLDHLNRQFGYVDMLVRDAGNDTICGYYAKIVTKNDTLLFIVTPNFEILCPVFMYEE